MKKLIYTTFSVTLAIAMFAFASFAFAAYSINTDPQDCRTVTIANHDTGVGAGSPCWTGTSVSAIDKQTVNVAIYFHNRGDSAAQNVVLKIIDPRGQTFGEDDSVSFMASISVNGIVVKLEQVRLNLDTNGDAELDLYDVTRYSRTTRSDNSIPGGSAIFSSSGLNIGTLNTGWDNQSVVKVAFTVNENGDTGGENEPYIDTENPDLHNDDTEVTLNGWFDANGLDTEVYFRYREEGDSSWDYTDREDRNANEDGNFDERLNNLDPGDYEYQACAENSEGTKCGRFTSGSSDSGYMEEFTIEDGDHNCPSGYDWDNDDEVCVQEPTHCPSGYVRSGNNCVPVQNTSVPTVTTLRAISTGSSFGVADGYYNSTGCNSNPSTYFRYGTSQTLGSQTPGVSRATNAGPMATAISGLASSTTYYYQAVATNCAGTGYGSIESFMTTGPGKGDPTPVIPVVSGGGSFIKLMITNNRDTVRQGKEIGYDLSWENVSNKDLKDLVLEVNFPRQMEITETERGEIARSGDSVIVNIPSLARREKGEMTIFTEINGGLRDGDPVVAQAIMAFENPTTQATENAIAYDADEFIGDDSGFLSLSFIEWLVTLLIILIILALIRYITRKDKKHDHHKPHEPAPTDHNPVGAAQDYIVYRPTPKS